MGKRKKKKKKALPPRVKRMKRSGRLASAPHWISKYPGKNLVRDYANHYGVDLLCAAAELRMLKVAVDPGYVERIKVSIEANAEAKRKREQKAREAAELEQAWDEDCDGTFAYIAGHTSGGIPFGVTWEELGERPPWQDEEGQSPNPMKDVEPASYLQQRTKKVRGR